MCFVLWQEVTVDRKFSGTIGWVSQPLPWLGKKKGLKNDTITNWTSEEFGNRNQNIHTHKDTQIHTQMYT